MFLGLTDGMPRAVHGAKKRTRLRMSVDLRFAVRIFTTNVYVSRLNYSSRLL